MAATFRDAGLYRTVISYLELSSSLQEKRLARFPHFNMGETYNWTQEDVHCIITIRGDLGDIDNTFCCIVITEVLPWQMPKKILKDEDDTKSSVPTATPMSTPETAALLYSKKPRFKLWSWSWCCYSHSLSLYSPGCRKHAQWTKCFRVNLQ